ncbi:MAG: molecular chaperone HtpG [Verrucomicrobiota bacterium]
MSTNSTENHEFQAEVKQLLDIVIHSLYTDKEIFIRELVSNAADALERLRFFKVSGKPILDENIEPRISLTTKPDDKKLIIEDTGNGMTKDEMIQNLGTIAHSGSKEFFKKLKEEKDAKAAVDVIGQFGVGFYSVFMAAKEVKVFSRSYNPEEQGHCWTSDGTGSYTVEAADGLRRGTKIEIELKDDDKEFSEDFRVESILKQYSNFVSFPIELNGKSVNTVQAIWTRSKNEVTDEEYNKFYQYIAHEGTDPQYRLHFSADAPLAIKSLLFVPKSNIEKMGMGRQEVQVSLHCKKVLIEPKCKGLLPEWMRFVKGVVDSEDIPLNISRESMQDSALMQKINKVLTNRLLKYLEEESRKRPEAYEEFYREFAVCLKEGVATDFTHRDALAKLLRFESSANEAGKVTSLADYIGRMKEGQEEIYYVMSPSRASAENSPYFEVFKSKGYEVLFLTDPWDEFVMEHLREFEGKKLQSGEKAEVELEEKDLPKEGALNDDDSRMLTNWIKESLGDRVKEVIPSKRLVDSPAAIVSSEEGMTASMRQILKTMKQDDQIPAEEAPKMEVNPAHSIMVKLNQARESKPELAKQIIEQVYDSSMLAAGLMDDPRIMVKRMNELMAQALS